MVTAMATGYKIPSLAEIHSTPSNGYKVVSTFSGCGGASLGLRWAGFDVLWASEFIPAAQEVYRANASPSVILDTSDIRDVTAQEILGQVGLARGELDLFEGSPPCASFSQSAVRKEKKWGEVRKYSDTKQRVDDLFFEYIRLVDGLQPKAFIAENVQSMTRGMSRGYMLEIVAGMQAAGYRVEVWDLNAKWLGVPQNRPRIVFVGVRNDMTGFPSKPEPQPAITLLEAIGDLEETAEEWIPESSKGHNMPSENHTPITLAYVYGRHAMDVPPGKTHPQYFNIARTTWSRPSNCICVMTSIIGAGGVVHPKGDRKFSISMLKRICGFPDDFVLTGSYPQRGERLGRAVPPPMYRAVGQQIREWLDECAA